MNWPLEIRLPLKEEATNDVILDRFLDYIASKNLQLYPAQEEAILELIEGKNIILNTPTGSGKSLVALAMHFHSMARGRRSFYTCPIKALVNEKFRDLCAAFGPERVGMMTGDGSVNQQAPIICCTAEILSNIALREGSLAAVDEVIMDEFHYYSDKQRGVAWQIPLLALPQTRFMLMSATLGEMEFFAKVLTDLNQKPTAVIVSSDRPVPLDFEYSEKALHETVSQLVAQNLAPVYLVNFSQREAAEEAQNLLSIDFSTKEEKQKIAKELEGVQFQSPYGKEIYKFLRHGVGLHHAGLLPKYRIAVERLAQQGLLKVVSGTDTLGVGVNIPIRTVLFTKLCKYDGEKTTLLSVRDFQQISGRAGRRGFDTRGLVMAQAPVHVIENLKLKSKAAQDPKKAKKLVLKNPPPKGFVMWTKESFNKLITSKPEALHSRFQISHSMLLNVLGRSSDGCLALRELICKSHETPLNKKKLRSAAFELFRTLLNRKIVEFVAREDSRRLQIRVNVDLQEDFSLNHSLALYLLDTIEILNPLNPSYALDLLTVVESILESPDLILRKQLDRVKSEKMAEMKMAGIEYDQRIEELEKLEHPKPNRDFIYETFNVFSAAHPWVGEENIRPKSIAREMFENFHSFPEYIREYDLHRIEGLLLRYLSEVFKVLEQTVPEAAKNDDVRAISMYFGSMVRQTDSSLLDDWERLRNGSAPRTAISDSEKNLRAAVLEPDVTREPKIFLIMVRNQIYAFLRALAIKDYEAALALIESQKFEEDSTWTTTEIESQIAPFFEDHTRLCTDPVARNPLNTHLEIKQTQWIVEQRLIDPEDHNDWLINFSVDLAQSKLSSKPVLSLVAVKSI